MACTRALLLLLSLSVPALTAPTPALGHTKPVNGFYFGTNDYEKASGTPPPAPASSFSFPSAAAVLARPSGRPITVTVEGNIGAGKSTLLNYFHHYPSIRVHKEPLAVWQNLSGTNLLELAYRDQARWGMTFESLVSLTMTEIHTADCRRPGQADWAPLKVMERSLHSVRSVFMEQLRPALSQAEMAVLAGWYDLLCQTEQLDTGVDLVIYLRTSPLVAYQRMVARARAEEAAIPLSYFQRMHQARQNNVRLTALRISHYIVWVSSGK